MAQDELQKSVQGIADPAARKKAYYTKQREQAESAADKGDRSAAATAGKIASKAGGTRTNFFQPETAQQRKATWYNDQASLGRGGAMANAVGNRLGEVLQPGDTEIGSLVGGAAKGLGSLAKGALRKFVPKAETAAEKTGSSLAQKVRQNLGKTTPVKKGLESRKALPSKPYEIKGGGTTKSGPVVRGTTKDLIGTGSKVSKSVKDVKYSSADFKKPKLTASGDEMKPSGRASSSPTARNPMSGARYNPKSGAMVGKRTPDEIIRASEQRRGTQETARMNKQAAKQGPRDRGMRSSEALGKPGSKKKGNYKPTKLKARE